MSKYLKARQMCVDTNAISKNRNSRFCEPFLVASQSKMEMKSDWLILVIGPLAINISRTACSKNGLCNLRLQAND